MLNVDGDDRVGAVAVQNSGQDSYPEFSPDGTWLAYASDVSGRFEVYAQSFPTPGPRILISTGGGAGPTWRADGRELYYYFVNDGIMHMYGCRSPSTEPRLSVGAPRELFQGGFGGTGPARGYDVTPDGKRFLFVRGVELPIPPPSQLVLVEHWSQELERKAP